MRTITMLLTALLAAGAHADSSLTSPIASADLVIEEEGGFVAVEAEHFSKQEMTDVRSWYLTTSDKQANLKPDADPNHVAGAGGGAYLERRIRGRDGDSVHLSAVPASAWRADLGIQPLPSLSAQHPPRDLQQPVRSQPQLLAVSDGEAGGLFSVYTHTDEALLAQLKNLLATRYYQVRTNTDIIGV